MNRRSRNSLDKITAANGFPAAKRTDGQGAVELRFDEAAIRPRVAARLRSAGCRHAAVVAEDRTREEGAFYLYDVLDHPEDERYLVAGYRIPAESPSFPAISAEAPAVNWMEREVQDWFGLEAAGHPNPRRVALHDHWPDVHPLRKDFPVDTELPLFAGPQHVYRPTIGEGVFYIPVGPVHAGIIEPGHFNFAVAGEPVIYLQLRMYYTHKGTEKLFEQRTPANGVFLAESVSGDSAFAHGLAYSQAVEAMAMAGVPDHARYARVILLELERLYNHVADIGAIATDVGFAVANAHATRIRELMLRLNETLTGSRLLRGLACPGGVRQPLERRRLDAALERLQDFRRDFEELVGIIEASDSTIDRLEGTGILTPGKARDLGIVGPAGRASGQDLDVRRDHPFAAYGSLALEVPVFSEGDVLRRMRVRIEEVRQSLALIEAAAAALPEGPWRAQLPAVEPGATGLGAVEGWRGEILYWIRAGSGGRIERCKVKDPSLNNWPALVEAMQGNIVPDFPVINKSFNLSYSGTDR